MAYGDLNQNRHDKKLRLPFCSSTELGRRARRVDGADGSHPRALPHTRRRCGGIRAQVFPDSQAWAPYGYTLWLWINDDVDSEPGMMGQFSYFS